MTWIVLLRSATEILYRYKRRKFYYFLFLIKQNAKTLFSIKFLKSVTMFRNFYIAHLEREVKVALHS